MGSSFSSRKMRISQMGSSFSSRKIRISQMGGSISSRITRISCKMDNMKAIPAQNQGHCHRALTGVPFDRGENITFKGENNPEDDFHLENKGPLPTLSPPLPVPYKAISGQNNGHCHRSPNLQGKTQSSKLSVETLTEVPFIFPILPKHNRRESILASIRCAAAHKYKRRKLFRRLAYGTPKLAIE